MGILLTSRIHRYLRRCRKLIILTTLTIFILVLFFNIASSNNTKPSFNKGKIRFIDTLSADDKQKILSPAHYVDESFKINRNYNKNNNNNNKNNNNNNNNKNNNNNNNDQDEVQTDLSVLSDLHIEQYKKEVKEFQIKYSFLKYDEESIMRFFKQHPPNYLDIDEHLINKERQIFYTKIFQSILKNKPLDVKPLKNYQTKLNRIKDYAMQLYYERFLTEPTLDEQFLATHGLIITDLEKQSLKEKHGSFLTKLAEFNNMDMKFGNKHKNGIVYVGGGKFSMLAMLSIVSLREAGSNLPVEVLIPNNMEHEPEFCDVHFPKLNARCILLSQVLSPEISSKIEIAGYQYKSILLMVSSFENVLLLDSDCFVIRNPDEIFNKEPFSTKGMVVWPDYWRRVTHPAYYEIANLPVGDLRTRYGLDKFTFKETKLGKSWFSNKAKTSIPLHDRGQTIPDPSSETGQLLINKKTHFNTILLSLYYNYYGPDYYYPLFSQGTQGEGDKETFIAAANALGEDFYQVNKRVEACGYWELNHFTGTGMFQFDPIVDHLNLEKFSQREEVNAANSNDDVDKKIGKSKKNNKKQDYDPLRFPNYFTKENSKMLFLHNNYPKIDPYRLIKDGNLIEKNSDNRIIKMIRLFGPVDRENIGKDLELIIWQYIQFYLCDLKIYLRAWDIELYNKEMNRKDVCQFISRHVDFLSKYEENAVFT